MFKVLLADDDKDDVQIFTEILQEIEIDAELQVVNDGDALLKQLSDKSIPRPEFLFLDLAMPKRTGFECLNQVRKDCDYDCMKIIILSDSVNVGEIDDAYDLGANHFLTKPSDLNSFRQILLHIFNDSSTTPPSRAEFVLQNASYHIA